MPVYLSPGVYFEELSPDHLGLLPSIDRPARQAVRPIRPVRSRWNDASSTAIIVGLAARGQSDGRGRPSSMDACGVRVASMGAPPPGASHATSSIVARSRTKGFVGSCWRKVRTIRRGVRGGPIVVAAHQGSVATFGLEQLRVAGSIPATSFVQPG